MLGETICSEKQGGTDGGETVWRLYVYMPTGDAGN